MNDRVLVIAAHSDDETLGCGGTILRHVAVGDEVHWVICTRTFFPAWPADVIERKNAEIMQVWDAYKCVAPHRLTFPTGTLERQSLDNMIEELRDVIEAVRPAVVYAVSDQDVHTDHAVIWRALSVVLKPMHMGAKYGVQKILAYETPSSTDQAPPSASRAFFPQVYHDITGHLERKLEILALYASEAQPEPMPRSPSAVRAWARIRGATVGVEYAEAFTLVREIE